jgi:3-dehydrosphinganine reductase
MHWFQGKRVLVTGGSSGIGRAAARILVESGAHVVIAARERERLASTVAELRENNRRGTIHAIALDISDAPAVARAAPSVLEMLGGLDVLINNAGIAHTGRFEETPPARFEELLRVNLLGTVHVTRAFLPHFVAQRSGHVCNVSSMLGFMGVFGYSAYAASKFAVTGFTECLRQELLPHGVGVSLVFPPNTDTPQLTEELANQPAESRAITRRAGVLPARQVANRLLRGIARRKWNILPGVGSRITWSMHRHAPSVLRRLMDFEMRRAARRQRAPLARAAEMLAGPPAPEPPTAPQRQPSRGAS